MVLSYLVSMSDSIETWFPAVEFIFLVVILAIVFRIVHVVNKLGEKLLVEGYADYGYQNRFHQQNTSVGLSPHSLREKTEMYRQQEGFGSSPNQIVGDGRYNIEGNIRKDGVLDLERSTEHDSSFATPAEGNKDYEAILHGLK